MSNLMEKSNYLKTLLSIFIIIIIAVQVTYLVFTGTYSISLFLISLLVSFFLWNFLYTKHNQKSLETEVIERADTLIGPLQQAISQKNIEEPLLSIKNSDSKQLNTRLQICSIYLLLCIIGTRQSQKKKDYVNSKQFTNLLEKTIPHLKTIYINRGTKKERIPTLITDNHQKIKQLIMIYCSYTKKSNTDPTLPIQAWFEEKSRINLSDTPYIYRSLSETAQTEDEQTLIRELCQPKKHSKLLENIRDKTETFMQLINHPNKQLLSQERTQVDIYIQKYLSAFLLIFGLVVINESNGNSAYMQGIEYNALKNKALMIIKSMLLNSQYLDGKDLTQTQLDALTIFIDKQIPSVENACKDYCNASQNKQQAPEIYLLAWLNSTTNVNIQDNNNISNALRQYVQQILAV